MILYLPKRVQGHARRVVIRGTYVSSIASTRMDSVQMVKDIAFLASSCYDTAVAVNATGTARLTAHVRFYLLFLF